MSVVKPGRIGIFRKLLKHGASVPVQRGAFSFPNEDATALRRLWSTCGAAPPPFGYALPLSPLLLRLYFVDHPLFYYCCILLTLLSFSSLCTTLSDFGAMVPWCHGVMLTRQARTVFSAMLRDIQRGTML